MSTAELTIALERDVYHPSFGLGRTSELRGRITVCSDGAVNRLRSGLA